MSGHLKELAGRVRDARPYNDFGRAVVEFVDAATVQVSGQGATILELKTQVSGQGATILELKTQVDTLRAEVATLKAGQGKRDGE